MIPAQLSLIRDHNDQEFSLFIDDYIKTATFFETMFDFLYKDYFP